jgi:hypothetical protein
MELWLADPAGRADLGDHLAAIDRIALLDQQLVAMGVGRDPAAAVLDQDEIAITAQLVAGVSDDAAVDRGDRRAARGSDVDPVVMATIAGDAVSGQDMTAHWPGEMTAMRQHGCRGFGPGFLGRARLAA